MKLEKLFNKFIEECRYSGRRSEKTIISYKGSFDLLVKLMPEIDLNGLTADIMTEFFKRVEIRKRTISNGRTVTGVKSSTLLTHRNKLNAFFNWLKRNGEIADNPLDKLPKPRVSYDDIKFLHKNEIEKILTAVYININWHSALVRKRNILIIYAMVMGGIRRNEILNIRISDLDLENKIITIRGETSKSKNGRYIPINGEVFKKLIDYLEERKKLEYKCEYLLVSENKDRKLTVHGLKHLVDKIKSVSGIDFCLHRLRHTFGVNFMNKNNDIFKLQKLLGHTDIRMTTKYARCFPVASLKEGVDKINLDSFCCISFNQGGVSLSDFGDVRTWPLDKWS